MKRIEKYILSDDEYSYFVNAVTHLYCPDLVCHDCSVCPMNTNIYKGYAKKSEYRCLLALMEDRLKAIKAMKEGEV